MILGVGIDFVSVSRIECLYLRYQERIAAKILAKQEREKMNCIKLRFKKIEYLAKRFAAKEALVKAFGTGFNKLASLQKIAVVNDKNGRPHYLLEPELENYIKTLFKLNKYSLHLSISDDKENALAVAILEAHEFNDRSH
jgi:holo-[acyl-carrier protein] synthase